MASRHLFAKETPKLLSISLTWKIYGIHYVNSDKQTNKLFFLVHPVHFYFLVVPDFDSHVASATHSDYRLVSDLSPSTSDPQTHPQWLHQINKQTISGL